MNVTFSRISGTSCLPERIRTEVRRYNMSGATKSESLWSVQNADDGSVIGVCGLMPVGKTKARIKHGFVLPEYRKKGVYREMVIYRAKIAQQWGCSTLEAICLPDAARALRSAGWNHARQSGLYPVLRKPISEVLTERTGGSR